MSLTNAQLTTLGTHIRANAAVAGDLAAGNLGAIADYYNGTATPSVFVFRVSVDTDTAFKSIDKDEYIAIPASGGGSVAELVQAVEAASLARRQEVALNLLLANGTYDPQVESNRDALTKIFPASMPNTRAAFLADATRLASYVESLFIAIASGPGGGDGSSQATSAIAQWSGSVSFHDIDRALELTA